LIRSERQGLPANKIPAIAYISPLRYEDSGSIGANLGFIVLYLSLITGKLKKLATLKLRNFKKTIFAK